MTRGIKWFGWIFIIERDWTCFMSVAVGTQLCSLIVGNLMMGFFFGVLHLAYGAYLYLTEKRKNAA